MNYGLTGGMADMKNDQFIEELRIIGLQPGSKSWQDYERGKKYIIEAKPAGQYTMYIRALVQYLAL